MKEDSNKILSTPFDGIKLNGIKYTQCRYADDTALLSPTVTGVQDNMASVRSNGKKEFWMQKDQNYQTIGKHSK